MSVLQRFVKRAARDPKTSAVGVAALLGLFFTHIDHDKVIAAAIFLLSLFAADSRKGPGAGAGPDDLAPA